ncbi:MAG: SpoIIE family protein phosphatase [Spirochaetota bacterium]
MELSFKDHNEKKLLSLMTIVKRINSTLDLEETLTLIMDEAKGMMSSEASSLMLIDRARKELYFNTATGEAGGVVKEIRVPLGKGIAGTVAVSGETITINDAEHDPRIYKSVDDKTKMTTRNLIAVPLIAKGVTLGVLEVLNKFDGDYTDDDTILLTAFADFAALAINNRELYREMQERAREIEALYRISQSINIFNELLPILQDNIVVLSEMLGADRISIIAEEGGKYVFKAGLGIPASVLAEGEVTVTDNVLAEVMRTGKSVVCGDIDEDTRFPSNKGLRYRRRSFIVSPLSIGGTRMGFISVTERRIDAPYQEKHMRLLEMLSQEIAENYNHIILAEASREKQLIETELSVTARMQNDILPKVFDSGGALDIAAVSIPAKTVGGDFYDFIPLGHGKYGIIIADVSGKGVTAGLFMAISRSILRVHFIETKDPRATLMKSNVLIHEDSKRGIFVTAFAVLVDTKARTLTYSNAGHFEQYIVRRRGGIEELREPSKPLGIVPDAVYKNKSIALSPGDRIVLYTDGVTEAVNCHREQFGEERLCAVLAEGGTLASEKLVENILEKVRVFQGKAEQFDDITLVTARLVSP